MQNQEKIDTDNTSTEDPATSQVCRYTTLWNVSIWLISPLVSGVARLNASSSSRTDTLNIWFKTAGCDSYFRQ